MFGLAVSSPFQIIDPATPFATPLEILPEWYHKCIGILSILFIIPFGENVNRYQNPFRRPVASSIFLNILSYSIWLSIGPLISIAEGLPLIG